jgi:hypothetical protein
MKDTDYGLIEIHTNDLDDDQRKFIEPIVSMIRNRS